MRGRSPIHRGHPWFGRLLLLAALAAALALAYLGGWFDHLSLQNLVRSRDVLTGFRDEHPVLVITLFLAGYIAAVSLSIPGSQILTITGGMLFGAFNGAVLSVIGASIGASNIFIIVSRLFRPEAALSRDSRAGAIAGAIRQNAWTYLLLLRLVPVTPFFAINLGAAIVGVRFSTFLATTVIGISPGAFAYAAFGSGLMTSFGNSEEPHLIDLLSPELIGATLALAVLAIGAIPVRRMLDRRR